MEKNKIGTYEEHLKFLNEVKLFQTQYIEVIGKLEKKIEDELNNL